MPQLLSFMTIYLLAGVEAVSLWQISGHQGTADRRRTADVGWGRREGHTARDGAPGPTLCGPGSPRTPDRLRGLFRAYIHRSRNSQF